MEVSSLIAALLAADEPREASTSAFVFFGLSAVAIFFLMIIWPSMRDRKRHRSLLKSLKKNDRVVTSGGIIGQFVCASSNGVEITLKVDDNTRIKFHRNYIVGILAEEKKESQ